MLLPIKNIIGTVTSFLQTGTAPPNTPPELEKELANTNHLSSKKFFLAFSGFLILGAFYVFSIAVLLLLNKYPELLPTYGVLFTKTIEVFATVMAVYLGSQALVDLKYNSSSNAAVETVNTTNVQKIDITNHVVGNEKEHDYSLD